MPETESVLVICFENKEAVRDFEAARVLIAEAAEDMPWSDDLREAHRLMEQAFRGLTIQRKDI